MSKHNATCSQLFCLFLLNSYCISSFANVTSYCPTPAIIQKNLHQMVNNLDGTGDCKKVNSKTIDLGCWQEKPHRLWDITVINIDNEEIVKNPDIQFTNAYTSTFPISKDSIFVQCNYNYSDKYKSWIAIVSLFPLTTMPTEGNWKDDGGTRGMSCNVDPFDEDVMGSGNILDCPFTI